MKIKRLQRTDIHTHTPKICTRCKTKYVVFLFWNMYFSIVTWNIWHTEQHVTLNLFKYKLLIVRGLFGMALCMDYSGLSTVASAYGTIWERIWSELMSS